MNAMQDLSVSHLHGYNGVTEKIKRAMYESAKQFVYIGFLLREVKEYKYYEEGSYKNVYEYAEFELGFKISSTKNFIAIAETFGVQEYTYGGKLHKEYKMCLQPKYEKFNYSQLVELLAMSDQQRNKAKPDMTVKQLREIKKAPIVEQVTMDELEAKAIGQTSGQTKEPEENDGPFVIRLEYTEWIFLKHLCKEEMDICTEEEPEYTLAKMLYNKAENCEIR